MTNRSKAGSLHREGYTLIEILVVLGILAMMLAISIPALRRPLAKSAVGQGALELRRAISTARVTAARQGAPVRFVYHIGSSHFETWSLNGTPLEPSGELPAGITFVEPSSSPPAPDEPPSDEPTATDDRFAHADPNVLPNASDLPVEPSATDSMEVAPAEYLDCDLLFLPDGRTTSTSVTLASPDYTIMVSLRGLTGEVTIGKPLRKPAIPFAPAAEPDDATPTPRNNSAPRSSIPTST